MRIGEEHWEQVRGIRLEMLADTPLAYLETLAEALALPDEAWRARARRGSAPDSVGLAAVETATGRWAGTMAAFAAPGESPLLVSVYVAPRCRGGGVADLLLDGIEAWAREHGARELFLQVHEHNGRARAYYRRRGFVETGDSVPYPLDPTARELRMVRALG